MRECTLSKISSELSGITWETVITENVNNSFNEFHNILCNIIDRHSPLQTKTGKYCQILERTLDKQRTPKMYKKTKNTLSPFNRK